MKRNLRKDGIGVTLEQGQDSLSASAENYFFRKPYKEEEKKANQQAMLQFANLSKDDLQTALSLYKEQFGSTSELVLQLMYKLMKEKSYVDMIEEEISLLEKAEKAKAYIEEQKHEFGSVKEIIHQHEKDTKTFIIKNKVYVLKIRVSNPSYRQNHEIHFGLALNSDVFQDREFSYYLETVTNTSLNDQDKIKKYVENKLKKYRFLFELENALLKEHADKFHVPERFLKEMDIQVYDSKEDILNVLKGANLITK